MADLLNFIPPYHLNQFGGYTGIITFDHHYILEKVDGGNKSHPTRGIYKGLHEFLGCKLG